MTNQVKWNNIVEFGTLNGDLNYVITGYFKLKDKNLQADNGHREYFHTIYFEVTTYKDGKFKHNNNKFITMAFDENGKFPSRYWNMTEAYRDKLQTIKNELMIVGELV